MLCPKCGKETDSHERFCIWCGTGLQTITMESGVKQQVLSSSFVEYAGFWRRFAAGLIDGVILFIGGWVILGILYGLFSTTSEESYVIFFLSNILSILLGWLYYAGMESSSHQATIGKMALGIVVTDLSGNRISPGKATGRHFGKIISVLPFSIGFIMAGFTGKKQALHDMMAGCLVIMKRSSPKEETAKYECPICHADVAVTFKYCPTCGAEMDWD